MSATPLIKPLDTLPPERFDTPLILKKLALASRKLAELKGVAASITIFQMQDGPCQQGQSRIQKDDRKHHME
ncbi:MAG: hypothetical protein ACPW60_13735 [Methylohalobius sp. ZOD2]|nr:hypothetical protein [Methylothermaceae bacterium]